MNIIVRGIDLDSTPFSYIKHNVDHVTYLNGRLVIVYDNGTMGVYDSALSEKLTIIVMEGGDIDEH